MTPSPSPSSAVRAAVDELGSLLEKATPGPWYRGGHCVYGYEDGGKYKPFVAEVAAYDDCDVIVALHRALPHLLAAIKAVDDVAEDILLHTVEPVSDEERGFIRGLDNAATRVRAALALAAVDVTETAE